MKLCDNCKHKEVNSNEEPCAPCFDAPGSERPGWEPRDEPVIQEKPMKKPEALPMIEEAESLTSAFEYLNEELFDNELPMVKLSFTRNPRVSKGHFAENSWVDEDGVEWNEIAINAQWYAEVQDFRLAMTTLVHEMIHHEQHVNGTQGRESYHNVQFVKRANLLGVGSLDPETGEPTTSGDKVSSYLIEGGLLEEALLVMPEEYIFPYLPKLAPEEPPQFAPGPGNTEPKKRGVKIKFTCAQCGDNAWGKGTLELACLKCNRKMVAAS